LTIDTVRAELPIKSKGVFPRYGFGSIAVMLYKKLKLLNLFPARMMICSFFFAYVLLDTPYLQAFQGKILMGLFQFFHIPAHMEGTNFLVGSPFSPLEFPSLHNIEILYLIFFLSFAASTRSNLKTRARILLNGSLCLIGFVVAEFLIAATMSALGTSSRAIYVEANVIVTNLVAGSLIEISLFSNMTFPRPTKVTPIIKTNNAEKYLYIAATFVISALLCYVFFEFFHLANNDLFVTFMAVSISQIMAIRPYITNFIYELKTPTWAKLNRSKPNIPNKNMSISFLIPAFNEEKLITRCIEGFDKIASKYPGWTEIVIINDGSSDNTRKVASEAILNLKHTNGKVYNIPHSGLVYALQYGLQRVKGDIIFRADSDSLTHEDALDYIIYHFSDPRLATISGSILSLEEKSWWQKVQTVGAFGRIFFKRQAELLDSIMTQGGTFTVFRKDALMKAGGWIHDIMGEDSDMTLRLARHGYRHEFDPRAIQYGNVPGEWKGVVAQRLKWSVSYYQVTAANADILKDYKPMSIQLGLKVVLHGLTLVRSMYPSFFLAYILTQFRQSAEPSNLILFSSGLLAFVLLLDGISAITTFYFLRKILKTTNLMKYFFHKMLFSYIQTSFLNLLSAEVVISTLSKFKGPKNYSEITKALRKGSNEELSRIFG